ncbi:MAG: hypothetical protein M3N95_09480 [Actinomycetota bacterium]|nr:hypothetical protein [Actinomycetota bacterium]
MAGIGLSKIVHHLTSCPSCGKAAAAHVALEQDEPVLIRLVCADGCIDNDTVRVAVIDALYAPTGAPLNALADEAEDAPPTGAIALAS